MFFDLAIVLVIIRFSLPCFEAILGDEAKGESCDRFIWATDGGEVELLSTAVDCKGSFMTSHLIGFQGFNLKRRIFDWLFAIESEL